MNSIAIGWCSFTPEEQAVREQKRREQTVLYEQLMEKLNNPSDDEFVVRGQIATPVDVYVQYIATPKTTNYRFVLFKDGDEISELDLLHSLNIYTKSSALYDMFTQSTPRKLFEYVVDIYTAPPAYVLK